jgi:hypothetical protein
MSEYSFFKSLLININTWFYVRIITVLPSENSLASAPLFYDLIYDQHPEHSFLKYHSDGWDGQTYYKKYSFDGRQDIGESRI